MAKGLFARLEYSIRHRIHRFLFREYSRRVGTAYDATGQRLDALLNFSDAFSAYSKRSRYYLEEARKIETALVPQSAARYLLEIGKAADDRESLIAAIAGFDPVWQRDMIAEAYAELASISPRRSSERQDAVERLFSLNAGMLPIKRLGLPVILDIDGLDTSRSGLFRRLKGKLRAAGFEDLPEGSPGRYRLRIRIQDSQASCELIDALRGITRLRIIAALPSFRAADLAAFSADLASAVFGGN
jgi:hypothetical protein